jgi:hypothetical protein
MANALEILKPVFNTPTMPGLGPERRAESWPIDEVEAKLLGSGLSGEAAELARSAALLWHDHFDESHTVSQDISSADGSFLHGVMHRREPDYPNAKYWFRLTGLHPSFPEISKRAAVVLAGSPLENLADGGWDSFAMVDAVAAAREGSSEYSLLQRVQRVEFEVLLERFCD